MADVQGSKSYMDVSMSANRISSRVKSVRNPVEAVISKLPGSESMSLDSAVLLSGRPSGFWTLDSLGWSLESSAAVWAATASAEVGAGQSSSISSKAEEKLSFTGWRAGGGGFEGPSCWTVGEVQKVSSSSKEAGVRQDSRGIVLTKSVGRRGWEARWLNAGCASRKLSLRGSAGCEAVTNTGLKLPSCLSSSWIRLNMLLIKTVFCKLGSVNGLWL